MPLSLDDVLNAPTDPTLLNRHLQTLGLVPAPMSPTAAAPAAPTTVAPMAPRTMPTMTPPVKTHETVHVTDSDPGPTETSHAEIGSLAPPAPRVPLQPLNVAGLDARQPETATPDAVPGGIQPMVPPTPSAGSSLLNAPRKTLESFKSREQDAPDIDRIAPVGQGPQLVEPGTAAYDRNKIDRMEDEKHNHYGTPENHPGVIGKILHGLAKAGNIAGDIVAPGTMALIPGTDLNKQVEEGRTTARMERERTGEVEQQKANTLEAGEKARAHEEDARAQRETAQIDNDKEKLKLEIQKENTPERQAYDSLIKQGKSPEDAFAELEKTKGLSKLPHEGQTILKNPGQLNAQMKDLWAQQNHGKPLPVEFMLPEDGTATKDDYDRVNKGLDHLEASAATQAQRDVINGMRQEGINARKEAQQERKDEKGRKIVQGRDANGRTVMGSAADAERLGWTNVMDSPSTDTSKALSARQWLPLAMGKGPADDPSKMGMLQLVDELDKRGQLGPLAGRWNEFMDNKWGGGTGDEYTDRLFEALRVKNGLAKTLLMNVHVGNRGGTYLFEHFEDLANEKKMSAHILREGIKDEVEYAKDRAMLPDDERATGAAPTGKKKLPNFNDWDAEQSKKKP